MPTPTPTTLRRRYLRQRAAAHVQALVNLQAACDSGDLARVKAALKAAPSVFFDSRERRGSKLQLVAKAASQAEALWLRDRLLVGSRQGD